jgi:hypothetical protein
MIDALVLSAAGSAVCGLVALVAGLLGAPRRLVLLVAALPPLALVGVIVVFSIGGK